MKEKKIVKIAQNYDLKVVDLVTRYCEKVGVAILGNYFEAANIATWHNLELALVTIEYQREVCEWLMTIAGPLMVYEAERIISGNPEFSELIGVSGIYVMDSFYDEFVAYRYAALYYFEEEEEEE